MRIVHTILIMIFSVMILSSCGKKEPDSKSSAGDQPASGKAESRIRGSVLNPGRSYVLLRNRADFQSKNDSVVLTQDGKFEFVVKLDTLTGYSLIFADPKPPVPRSPANPNPEPDTGLTEMSLVLDKGFDIEVTFDARNPQGSAKFSGTGAEISEYAAHKAFKGTAMNNRMSYMLRSSPEEYLAFIDSYYADMLNLIGKIPAGSEKFPENFKQKEEKNLKYFYNKLKLQLAFDDIRNAEKGKYANSETYLSFMNDVPFDDPGEVSNPMYTNLISTYADFILRKENPGKMFTVDERLGMKYELYKELFKDPATRDEMLYNYLLTYKGMSGKHWHIDAVEEFAKSASSDSLKQEVRKIKDMVPGRDESGN